MLIVYSGLCQKNIYIFAAELRKFIQNKKKNACTHFHGKIEFIRLLPSYDVIWQLCKYTVSPWPKLKKLLGTKDHSVDTLKKNLYNHIEWMDIFFMHHGLCSLMHTVCIAYTTTNLMTMHDIVSYLQNAKCHTKDLWSPHYQLGNGKFIVFFLIFQIHEF